MLEYGLTQESQFLLHNELSPHLSSTISFEIVYKALLVGDGRELLLPNKEFQLKYRNGVRPAAIYAANFEVDPQFQFFEENPGFDPAVGAGVERSGKGARQYLANFFGPKRERRAPIPLIYFAIQTTGLKKLNAEGEVYKILTAARGVPAQFSIDPAQHAPNNNLLAMRKHPCQRSRLMTDMALA